MKKKAIVIGAGVGGLVCATKLAKEGLDVTLLEKHNKVGGLAQAWTRSLKMPNGDEIDATFELTHAVSGFQEDGSMRRIYTELGVDWDRIGRFEAAPKFVNFKTEDGNHFEIFNTIPENFAYLLREFPHETNGIRRLFNLYDKINQERDMDQRKEGWQKRLEQFVEPKVDNPLLKIPMYLLTKPNLVMRRNQTFKDVLDEFLVDENLRAGLSSLMGYGGLPPSKISAILDAAIKLSYWTDGGPMSPAENSYQAMHEELARVFVEKYGGDLKLRAKVTGINVENRKVKGVNYRYKANDEILNADYIVVGSDMKKSMLPLRKYLPKRYANRLEDMTMSLSLMNTHVVTSLDLFARYDELSAAANVLAATNESIETANGENFPDDFLLYVSVPTLRTAAGLIRNKDGTPNFNYHIVDIVMQNPSYDKVSWLRNQSKTAYNAWKEDQGKKMIEITDRMLIPGFAGAVRKARGYTATTHEKFCDCSEGAVYTFDPTPEQFIPNRFSPKTPIEGLWLTGATVMSAGVAGAIMGGKLTYDMMIKCLK
jgi:phytoene dehydrogenase-like protein